MNSIKKPFSKDILTITNIEEVVDKICNKLKEDVLKRFKRYGAVIGISGGIDSSVTLALAVRALGSERVFGIMLPEMDSSSESELLARQLAAKFNVNNVIENISGALDGFGCYKRRDEAVKRVVPSYNPETDKMKVVIPKDFINKSLPPVHYVSVTFNDGTEMVERLPLKEYLQIVAASNFKQRSRMSMLYYYGESMHYCVIGTPNKHEVQQGFFVKNGDSGADVMPISNLYKTQVYQIGEYLGVTEEILKRTPTSDTYSAEQSQEEFFFQMPFKTMDLLWYGYENNYDPNEVASVLEMSREEVEKVFKNFSRKIQTTEYLRAGAISDYYID